MRVTFCLAYSAGLARQIINAIPAMRYIPAGEIRGRNYNSMAITVGGEEYHFLVHQLAAGVALPWPSAAASELWGVAFMVPCDSMDFRRGCKLYRAMRRFILSSANRNGQGDWYLQGPWSLAKVADAYPAFAAEHFAVLDSDGNPTGSYKVPIMFSGDPAPELVALVDYSPDDIDSENDVEPEEGTLY